jgi:hypothetical protein
MIAQATPPFDVFLSFSTTDTAVAEVVEGKFREAGLRVFNSRSLEAGSAWPEAIRDAIAECFAAVVLVTRSSLKSAWFMLEVGAAMGWEKPLFPLLHDLSADELPVFLRSYQAVPIVRVHEVVEAVRRISRPLTASERTALVRAYESTGLPADRLVDTPSALTKATRAFNRATDAGYSPERVLQELLRLRKQNGLHRVSLRRPKGKGWARGKTKQLSQEEVLPFAGRRRGCKRVGRE